MTTLPQHSPMRLPRPNPAHLAIPSANGHAPAQTHAPANALTASDVWRIIRANLWLIIGLVAVAGMGGYFLNTWLAMKFPRYTSTAIIRVQVPSELPTVGTERMLIADPSPQSIELEQQTQAASLKNKYFLGSLLEQPNSPIRKTDWFQSFGNRIDLAKADLERNLDVTPLLNTRFLEVSFSAKRPDDALTIVREVVQRHIDDRMQNMQNILLTKSGNLDTLINNYQSTSDALTGRISDFDTKLADNFGTTEQGPSALGMEMAQLISMSNTAQREAAEAQSKYDTFVAEVQQGLTPVELAQAMGHADNPSQAELTRLQAALAVTTGRYGENSQQVQDIKAEMKSLQQSADDTDGQNREKMIAVIKQDLATKRDVAVKIFKDNEARLRDVEGRLKELASTDAMRKQLVEQKKNVQELLNKAHTEQDNLTLMIQQKNWGTASMSNQPDLPDAPSFPKLSITMTLSIALGLIAALSIAFLRELMDTTVRSPRDIAKVGQLNLLGMIPHEGDDPESAGARLPLAIYEAPHSIIAEQFRQVRTRLQHSASLDTVRSLMVTGTSPGDGKTTVACNLAAGLALNGRRILLVDANFRRPMIHGVFNIPNDVGFGDVLNSVDLFDQAVRESEVPNLSVLPSGAKPANSTELLESQLLVDFIERALEEYDHVIFDSGPLLIVSETAALAPRVDGVVSVVRARGNSRGMLQRLRDQLRQLKAEHLGVILNAVRSQSGGYYAPMIKTYYAYQNR